MPCCCVPRCHNRVEKGYKLYKLPQGSRNKTRRKLWIQNINRRDLPEHAYVCQVHFTDDQFELGRADNKMLLKWNAVPTLFFNHKKKQENCPKQEITVTVFETIDESDKSEEAVKEENLNFELKKETEVKMDNHTNNSSEIAALKDALNASQQEIRTLRTIISQLQAIIKILIDENTD